MQTSKKKGRKRLALWLKWTYILYMKSNFLFPVFLSVLFPCLGINNVSTVKIALADKADSENLFSYNKINDEPASIETVMHSSKKVDNGELEKQIADIRTWYSEVEAVLERCIVVTAGSSAGPNAEVTGYYDTISQSFVKVVDQYMGDWNEGIYSYYFHEGELFFLFEEVYTTDGTYSAEELGITDEELWRRGPQPKSLLFTQERKYFRDNECIQHLTKQVNTDVEDDGWELLSTIPNEVDDASKIDIVNLTTYLNELFGSLKEEMERQSKEESKY